MLNTHPLTLWTPVAFYRWNKWVKSDGGNDDDADDDTDGGDGIKPIRIKSFWATANEHFNT